MIRCQLSANEQDWHSCSRGDRARAQEDETGASPGQTFPTVSTQSQSTILIDSMDALTITVYRVQADTAAGPAPGRSTEREPEADGPLARHMRIQLLEDVVAALEAENR